MEAQNQESSQQNAYNYCEIETQKLEKNQDYQKYLTWLKQNGVLTDPRVRYPSVFVQGKQRSKLIGVSASKAIQKGRVVIAIPYNLLITVQKVKQIQPLRKIIEENPDVFSIKEDRPFMILVLYITSEMLKQQKSFYYPYFKIAESPGISNWSHWDMTALQNKHIEIHRADIHQIFENLSTLLEYLSTRQNKYVLQIAVLKSSYYDLHQSLWLVFAFDFHDTHGGLTKSRNPLFGSLFGGSNYVSEQGNPLKIQYERKLKKNITNKVTLKNGYTCRKNIANLSIFNRPQLNLTQQEVTKIVKPKKSRRVKFIQKHKRFLQQGTVINLDESRQNFKKIQNKILFKQYDSGVHNLRQLHLYESSCSQDNDTDQETLFERTLQQQKFMISEKRSGVPISQKNKHTKKYWQIYRDKTLLDEYQQSSQSSNEKDGQRQSNEKQINAQKLTNSSKGSSQLSDSSSDDTEQDYTWFDSQGDKTQNIYICMQTRQKTRKNQQLCNFYGRRSNQFLLLGYNFVMGDQNYYDSFALRMKLSHQTTLTPEKLIFKRKLAAKDQFTREVRLKRNKISTTFINHCRCFILMDMKQQSSKKEGVQSCLKEKGKAKIQVKAEPQIRITIPFDLQIEKKVICLAKDIIKSIKNQHMNSIEDDEQLLFKTNKHETEQAIKFRLGSKKILKSNLEMLNLCQGFLKRWKNGKIAELKQKQMQNLRKCYGYLCGLQRSSL